MNRWNDVDPYQLDYIKKQAEAIKTKHNISSDEGLEEEETSKIEDILEDQLSVLKDIQHTLEGIEVAASKKGWKKLF